MTRYLQSGLQEIRVDLSDTVDSVRANNAQVAHVNTLDAIFLNHGHSSNSVHIAGEFSLYVLEKLF